MQFIFITLILIPTLSFFHPIEAFSPSLLQRPTKQQQQQQQQQPISSGLVGVVVDDDDDDDNDNDNTNSNNNKNSNTNLDCWTNAKMLLRRRDICVVTVSSGEAITSGQGQQRQQQQQQLQDHLQILQSELVDNNGNNGPSSDIDLRARISMNSMRHDCLKVLQLCNVNVNVNSTFYRSNNDDDDDDDIDTNLLNLNNDNRCAVAALEELARGMISLAEVETETDTDNDGLSPLEHNNGGAVCCDNAAVYIRIVCASNYRARDPPFHTDKASLRGYVTLRGVGTEIMTRPCSPIEYLALRTFGTLPKFPFPLLPFSSQASSESESLQQQVQQLRCAQELEFIVMKGDYYKSSTSTSTDMYGTTTTNDHNDDNINPSFSSLFLLPQTIWQRASACVHRSPPGVGTSTSTSTINSNPTSSKPRMRTRRQRVIISFDLADGDDDREWYQTNKQRQWRNGVTQRKSNLVA